MQGNYDVSVLLIQHASIQLIMYYIIIIIYLNTRRFEKHISIMCHDHLYNIMIRAMRIKQCTCNSIK